jgi:hypothetical protein
MSPFGDDVQTVEKDVETLEHDVNEDVAPVEAAAYKVGEVVNVVRADGTKYAAIITRFGETVSGKVTAFVHKLEEEIVPISTVAPETLRPDQKAKPVLEKVGS